MLIITHGIHNLQESEFEVRDYEGGQYTAVRVHPWHRHKDTAHEDRSVFVSVGHYTPDGSEAYEDECEPVWNIIVDRDEFVTGLLETFPELKRAE